MEEFKYSICQNGRVASRGTATAAFIQAELNSRGGRGDFTRYQAMVYFTIPDPAGEWEHSVLFEQNTDIAAGIEAERKRMVPEGWTKIES